MESWGAGFRTEFQLLAGFHRRLLAASEGALRTLLLSATISRRCEALLRTLFGHGTAFRVVRANRLRPEPGYWFSVSDSASERRDRVLEAVRHAPRPAILYVTQPRVACQWAETLWALGYRRVGCFTGETGAEERRRLNRAWQADEIDLMVANSAFGLGVDKGDVRTVIHAALPETIDRYYQEVGRAGRDGCSAFGLLCLAPDDINVPEAMLSSAVVSTDVAMDRLRGLMQTAEYRPGAGNTALLDMDAAPYTRPDLRRSERSREWNEHTLLLAQRARLLQVVDSRPDELQAADGEPRALIEVQILDDAALRAPLTKLRPRIEVARSQERADITATVRQLDELVRRYSGGKAERCLAEEFAGLYPDCTLACGGCPVCRRRGDEPYAHPSDLVLEAIDEDPVAAVELHPALVGLMGADRRLIVDWAGERALGDMRRLKPLIVDLVRLGMRQVILPLQLAHDEEWTESLVRELGDRRIDGHVVVNETWANDRWKRPLFPLPTVVVFPLDDRAADGLYRSLALRPELRSVAKISIAHHHLVLPSLGGRFRDKENGLPMRAETLAKWVRDQHHAVLLD